MNRSLRALAVLVSVVALLLATQSQSFTRMSVDGRTLRMLVAGHGPKTVVFESGLGGPLEHWGKVQPAVSRFARTVSYDRAGIGLSDDGPRPRDGRRIAVELHQALRLANIAPPYILVGASLGGPYVMVFAGLFPDEVAGMVLVDPTPDNARPDRTGFPELDAAAQTLEQARSSRVPRHIPVVLIDALWSAEVPFATDAIRKVRLDLRSALEAESLEYKRWLAGIPGSRLVVTSNSGHNVAQEQPHLVVDTIRQVVEAATETRHR